MDAQQIKVLIDAMAASDLQEMEAQKDGWTLRLVRQITLREPSQRATTSVPTQQGNDEHCAAMPGVVFLQPSPGAPPFVTAGQAVSAGQVLCVIEAMKVFNEVHAQRDGVVDQFLVVTGQEVDAGQPLLRLR